MHAAAATGRDGPECFEENMQKQGLTISNGLLPRLYVPSVSKGTPQACMSYELVSAHVSRFFFEQTYLLPAQHTHPEP